MENLLVLGYFGYVDGQLDGQTIKTRNIYALLKGKESEIGANVVYFDTQTFKLSKYNVLRMMLCVFRARKVFYLGAHNNLKYLFPFIFLVCWLSRKSVHFVVVGGWLFEFLKGKPLHRYMLKRITVIYPQTLFMCQQLKSVYGFRNVSQLNNFRIYDRDSFFNIEEKSPSSDVLRFVFMARVHPMKGVDVVFKMAEKLRAENLGAVVVDIYGPIYEPYRDEFESKIEFYKEIVCYKGVLQPNEVPQALANYDFMLFPTKYYTEGFPGSILDSYIAGVPVIVSRWKYAVEFVAHNSSGLICEFDNDDVFVETALGLIANKPLADKLKKGVGECANRYSPEMAWETLKMLI